MSTTEEGQDAGAPIFSLQISVAEVRVRVSATEINPTRPGVACQFGDFEPLVFSELQLPYVSKEHRTWKVAKCQTCLFQLNINEYNLQVDTSPLSILFVDQTRGMTDTQLLCFTCIDLNEFQIRVPERIKTMNELGSITKMHQLFDQAGEEVGTINCTITISCITPKLASHLVQALGQQMTPMKQDEKESITMSTATSPLRQQLSPRKVMMKHVGTQYDESMGCPPLSFRQHSKSTLFYRPEVSPTSEEEIGNKSKVRHQVPAALIDGTEHPPPLFYSH